MIKKTAILVGLALVAAVPAWAGNGNMLHGFGPVNSSMGGAGAGLWVDDPVGPLMFNPALISESDGNFVSFGTEFFKDGIEIEATLFDGTKGIAKPSNQLGILPAFGWTLQADDSRFGIGYGLIAIAGFRTDNPEVPGSILFDRPTLGGFGRIYTDHRVVKIPLALSYKASDKLTVALSLNGYVGELAIAPLPNGVYDTVGDDSTRYYPHGDGLSSSYAVSVQPGFLYRVNDMIAIGGSLTTAQNFDPFEWNSTFAHPDDPNFGKHRLLEYDLDGPLNVTLGTGIKLNPKTKIAADVTWFKYDGVSGFGSPGGIVDRVIQPFGWKNVWAFKLGGEHKLSEKQTLRLGYNYGSTPLPKRNTLTATGAPAFFKHHFSLGHSYRVNEYLRANLGAYHVPRGGNVGPLLELDNNEIGTVDESNTLTSVQLGFSWAFGGSHAAGNSAARN